MLASGFLNLGMVLCMAAALVVAVRRADRADRGSTGHDGSPRGRGMTNRWATIEARWAAVLHRGAEAVDWVVHPRAHHRH